MSDNTKFMWIVHGCSREQSNIVSQIFTSTFNESTAYRSICINIMKYLTDVCQFQGDDPNYKEFISSQMKLANSYYKNNERITSGPNKGKLLIDWKERYKHIYVIYEKIKPENTDYYICITKQKIV